MAKRTEKSENGAFGMLQAVLLPIASIMLRRGFGIGELIDAAKLAYIQAAMREVIPPGKKVNVSRIAVATGLTRKEVAALLRRAAQPEVTISAKKVVEQRALRVLRGWTMDPLFQRPDGKPAELELRGEGNSFAQLVRKYGGDVTPVSVLRELERMQAVSRTRAGKLKFQRVDASSREHSAQQMTEFARLFRDFARTIQQVYDAREPQVFYGFKESEVASPHQAALFQRTFTRRALTLLESMDQWVAHQAPPETATEGAEPKTRIGVGVYLVQEELAPPDKAARKPGKYTPLVPLPPKA